MYYRLDWKVSPPDPELANTSSCADVGVAWTMGQKFVGPVSEPIRCSLNPKRGRRMRDVFLIDVPLFSDRLVQVLRAAGVDNLDTYSAEIATPEGEVHKNYVAVNILGLVACADLTHSEYLAESEPPTMEFFRLVINESATGGIGMFRLAEDSLHILVSADVAEAVRHLNLVGASLLPVMSAPD